MANQVRVASRNGITSPRRTDASARPLEQSATPGSVAPPCLYSSKVRAPLGPPPRADDARARTTQPPAGHSTPSSLPSSAAVSASPPGPPASRRSATPCKPPRPELGLILLAIAAGAVIAMPLAGLVVNRFGPARTVAVLATVLSVGLVVLRPRHPGRRTAGGDRAVPDRLRQRHLGRGHERRGAAVEQRLGRTIMPRFHAGFSVGTVVGALGGRRASRSTSRSPPTCSWRW